MRLLVDEKIQADIGLTQTEWRRRAGYSYRPARALWERADFPKVGGKVTWSDWVIFRRRVLALEPLDSPTAQDRGRDGGHKAGASLTTSDSPNALPPRAELLRATIRLSGSPAGSER